MENMEFGRSRTIALVGCGAWGTNILRDLLALKCRVLVADIDPHARTKAAANGAAAVFPGTNSLPECDGYVVAVPIPDLTPVCADLLKHKKPIFAEKTLCRSPLDFKRLSGLGGSRLIFAMHKWQYHPGIEALRQVAQSKKLGEIEELHATRHAWVEDFHGGDVFWTLAVHDLTIVRHILGTIPKKIRALNVIRDGTGLPIAFTAWMGEKPAVVISVNSRHCRKRSGVSIHGPKGSAELYSAYDGHISIRDEIGEGRVAIDKTLPLFLELQEFVGYLHQGPEPRCSLKDTWQVTRSILDLRKKAALTMDR